MQLDWLKSFCTINESGSFSKAADKLFCSQASISKQIRCLENELGYTLFDRNGKKFTLNNTGKIVYEHSQKIIDEISLMYRDLYNETRKQEEIITFGATNFIGIHLVPTRLSTFKSQNPDIAISFTIDFLNNIIHLLMIGQISFALLPECKFLRDESTIATQRFMEDEMLLVMAPTHPWATRPFITLPELETTSFLISQPNSATRHFLNQQFSACNITLKNLQNLYNIETIKQALFNGESVSILSKNSVCLELKHNLLCAVPIKDFPCTRELFVVHKKNKKLSIHDQRFIETFMTSKP